MSPIEERIDDIMASDGLSLKSFIIHDDLNRDIWDEDDGLKPDIRKGLLKIAGDFIDTLDLNEVIDVGKIASAKDFVKDVLFIGSLASYNYSSYADVDLHVLVDTSVLDLPPDGEELLKQYFWMKKNDWNTTHSNLTVKGYDVELYVQNVKDENAANGVYSVVHDQWIKHPATMIHMRFNANEVKSKALWYINRIDTLEEMVDGASKEEASEVNRICTFLKDKLIQDRRGSLNGKEKNEMAVPNLVFKVLRRTGHIGKLNDLMVKCYDISNSVDEDCVGGVATLGGDGFGEGKPALTKGDYHLPGVLTKRPTKRKLTEGTKVTLTLGQLKTLLNAVNKI